jgi:hypothetical protein
VTDPAKGISDWYEHSVELMREADAETASRMLAWGDLSGETKALWTLAYASTLEAGVHLGRAMAAATEEAW